MLLCESRQDIIFVDSDGVRLRLWTAATNGYIVHPTDDI
jgi:hypothetical protein